MDDAIAGGLIVAHRVVARVPGMRDRLAAGVNRAVGERRVDAAIGELTREGDVVWDVGANIGVYTRTFLDRVGPAGHVVAVDPVPDNAEQLRRLGPSDRLTVVEAALSHEDGTAGLAVSGAHGETSSIGGGAGTLAVRVLTGDGLLDDGVPQPQVVKVDVEGFERDVLEGSRRVLAGVREVIVEVHFAAVIARGRSRDPLSLLAVLRAHGLRPRWIDSSHLVASRPG